MRQLDLGLGSAEVIPRTVARKPRKARAAPSVASTREAFALFDEHKYAELSEARAAAVFLCKRDGRTNVRAIRAWLAAIGTPIDPGKTSSWLGRVCSGDDRFTSDGHHEYAADGASGHQGASVVKWWKLVTP